MFSKSCEYAIKAVLFIASVADGSELVSLNTIAKAIDSPSAYTSKILQQLGKAEIISSVKGHTGGYYIEKQKREKLFLSDIVNAMDGDAIYTACALGLKKCSAKNPCPLHENILKIRNDLKIMLENTRVKDLANGISEKEFMLK